MTTMTAALEQSIEQQELHDALVEDGALTVAEIAARAGVTLSVAYEAVRIALDAGYVDRDESGKYAPWCAWPRIGF